MSLQDISLISNTNLIPTCRIPSHNLLGYATQRFLQNHHTHPGHLGQDMLPHRNDNYHVHISKHKHTTYSANTQINVEIIVSLHIYHIHALLINYNTCTYTQHVNEHKSGTYILI